MLQVVTDADEPGDSMLARQLNADEAAARPEHSPVLQEAAVLGYGTGLQVIGRQDQEQLGGVVESQEASRRERAWLAVLLDALQIQQTNERQPVHLRPVEPPDGW